MESWIKEQKALERQIRSTIETSGEIHDQNVIQLELHLARTEKSIRDHEEWLLAKVIERDA